MPIDRKLIDTYSKRVSMFKCNSFEKVAKIFLLGSTRFPIPYLDIYTNAFIFAIDFVHNDLNIIHNKILSVSKMSCEQSERIFKERVFPERGEPETWELNAEEKAIYHEVFSNLIHNPDLIEICTHRASFTEQHQRQPTQTSIVLKDFCTAYWTAQNSAEDQFNRENDQIVPYHEQSQDIFSSPDILRFISHYLSMEDLDTGLKRVNRSSYSIAFFENMRRRFTNDDLFHKFFPYASKTAYRHISYSGASPEKSVPFVQRNTMSVLESCAFRYILVTYFWITAANELENIRAGAFDDLYDEDMAILQSFSFSVSRQKPRLWSGRQSQVYSYSTACVVDYLGTTTSVRYRPPVHFNRNSRDMQSCAISKDRKNILECRNRNYIIHIQEDDRIVNIYSHNLAFAAVLNSSQRILYWSTGRNGLANEQYIDNISYIYSTASAFAGISADKSTLTCWGDPNAGGLAPAIPPGRKIVRMYSTMRAFLAIFDDHSFICWGDAACGGITPTIPVGSRMCHVCTTGKAFAATLSDGRIICWGDPLFGGVTPTIIPQRSKIRRLCANQTYFAVLIDDEITQGEAVHIENKIIWWGSRDSRTHVENNLSSIVKIGKINRIWGNPANNKLIVLTEEGREVTIMPS